MQVGGGLFPAHVVIHAAQEGACGRDEAGQGRCVGSRGVSQETTCSGREISPRLLKVPSWMV